MACSSRLQESDVHHQGSLPRRTFLRGMGVTLALPLLDAMVPALSAHGARRRPSRSAASGSSTCRTAWR